MSDPKPGLRYRAEQLRTNLHQLRELKRTIGGSRPADTADARIQLSRTREALRRQVRVQAGLPALSQ